MLNKKEVQIIKKLKETKAITLIALIITVIIMIIIAGVSISALNNSDGLFANVNKSKNVAERAQIIESAKMEILMLEAGKAGENLTSEELEGLLTSKYGTLSDEENILDRTLTTNKGNYEILVKDIFDGTFKTAELTLVEMFQNAVNDNCTNEDGTCTNPNHLHIGDYVNYQNPSSGNYEVTIGTLGVNESQKYYVSQNQLNWRVLGIEGEGENAKIKLIAGSPMKRSNSAGTGTDETTPYLLMCGASGYINSVRELNNICALYENEYAEEARSVTISDIDKLVGVTGSNISDYCDGYGEAYEFQDQYTPESWLNNESTTLVKGNQTGYYYEINYTLNLSNNRIYRMMFENTEVVNWPIVGRIYWLASKGITNEDDYASFGVGTVNEGYRGIRVGFDPVFDSEATDTQYGYGVRPVVILKSDVLNKDINKIADKTEVVWNYEYAGPQ